MSTSERVSLVVPGKPDVCLVGILEHVSGGTRTRGDLDNVHEKFEQPPRPIALVGMNLLQVTVFLWYSLRFYMGHWGICFLGWTGDEIWLTQT